MTNRLRTYLWTAGAILVAVTLGCGVKITETVHENGTTEASQSDNASAPTQAVCVLRPVDESGVSGVIHIAREGDELQVTGTIAGLEPGKHGFHVHQFGDLTSNGDGKSAGGHFAPHGDPHGKPSDAKRHVGDLGNIEANAEGEATVEITDSTIALAGENSIIGRAFVVHAGEDQFTQPSGDAGARVAFGVIGVASDGQ